MTAGANRFAAFWLGLALLVGGLTLMPGAALGASFVLSPSSLVAPCNPGNPVPPTGGPIFSLSCVDIDSSNTWGGTTPSGDPIPTSFNIVYGTPVGDEVPFEITDLVIPPLDGGGVVDEFVILSNPTGTLNTATGFMEFDFDLQVKRNGGLKSPFTLYMSSGITGAVDTGCGDVDPISGFNMGSGALPQEVYVVGQSCVDLRAPGDPVADWRLLGMSLRAVPEPSTLLLLGTGLAGLARLGRRRE